jgi:hypothetical protein
MAKVEGSNPFIRFRQNPRLSGVLFCVFQGRSSEWSASVGTTRGYQSAFAGRKGRRAAQVTNLSLDNRLDVSRSVRQRPLQDAERGRLLSAEVPKALRGTKPLMSPAKLWKR